MNDFQKIIEKELSRFNKLADERTMNDFRKKIRHTEKLTKSTNIDEHICSFFCSFQ